MPRNVQTMNKIISDCGEIWNRLFDHRPFLSGEILFFQEEFESKRSDREVSNLFEVLETLTEIRDSKTEKIQSLCNNNLLSFQEKLDTALKTSLTILDQEETYDIDSNLDIKREIRKEEWERFQTEIKDKFIKIDEVFDNKEKELHNFYAHLDSSVLKTPIATKKD